MTSNAQIHMLANCTLARESLQGESCYVLLILADIMSMSFMNRNQSRYYPVNVVTDYQTMH